MSDARSTDALDELWGALAESDAQVPPPGLGERILNAALLERPAGRPSPPVPAISPVEAFDRQVSSFDSLLASLGDVDWRRHVLRDLDVQGLVGHLIGVEAQFQESVRRAELVGSAPAADADAAGDHVADTQPVAMAQRGRPAQRTHADWRQTARRSLEQIGEGEKPSLETRIALHGMRLPLGDLLVIRTFELWIHEEDIRRATERPLAPPDPSTLTLMTELATRLLPAGVSRIGGAADGGTARIVLTGAGGGCWTVRIGAAQAEPARVRIVTGAVDFCRLVGDRVKPFDIEATITGDRNLAGRILNGACALALD
jgi:uncharacterized protein (TIGR03083 family)